MTTTHTYPPPAARLLITISALMSVLMVTLDTTIAVVALPRIQSNLAASSEQISWVLTSYMIAGAIATPLSGWLADRFGRSRVMALSVLFFTAASLGCGMSANLEMLVLFRFIQGAAGASLVPLSQVLLLDIYPPERHGPAIAWFGVGTLIGPTIGPTLGAWLTEYTSWRMIFLINAPVGIAGFLGLMLFARDRLDSAVRRFDLKGFAAVSIALTSFQLMLDRGQMLDWFSSTEICIEATVAAAAAYIAVVHLLTARAPFITLGIFRDGNFLVGTILSAVVGVLLNGVVPIMTSMMQQLLGYPVTLAGMLALPRAIGNMMVVFVVGRLVSTVAPRYLIFFGMLQLVGSLWVLSHLSLDAGPTTMAMVALFQGLGSGFLFLPLTITVFSTLPPHLRNEGSTLFSLTRSLGGAAGLSLIQATTLRDMAGIQSRMVEHVTPDNPVVQWAMPAFDIADTAGVGRLMGEITRQTAMVAYVDTYSLILILAAVMAPLCLLMRAGPSGRAPAEAPVHAD